MLLLAGAAVAGTSRTIIPPGQAFLLGGEQREAFDARVRNIGPVAVEVLLGTAKGQTPLRRLAPGEDLAATVPARTVVVFRNAAAKPAELGVEFNRSVDSLSMRYEAAAP